MLSVVVCTYKRLDLLAAVLADLEQAADGVEDEWELIVVDNAGEARVAQACRLARINSGRVRYFHEPRLGLSAARNRAVREAAGRWLLFLDDDVRFDSKFLAMLLREVAETTEAGVLCPRLVTDVGHHWPGWLVTRVRSGVGQFDLGQRKAWFGSETKAPVGACVCIRREVCEEFGPFAENLDRTGSKLFGGGETLLLRAALRSGVRGLYLPDIVVQHDFVSEKNTKAYWRRQGFYGGRSYVRMLDFEPEGRLRRAQAFALGARSVVKAVLRLAMAATPLEAFENQYRSLAHWGRAYEAFGAVMRVSSRR